MDFKSDINLLVCHEFNTRDVEIITMNYNAYFIILRDLFWIKLKFSINWIVGFQTFLFSISKIFN
jgi:hypothetical protein